MSWAKDFLLRATASEETQFLSWEMSLFEVDNNVTKILPSRCSINLAEPLSNQERLWNFEFKDTNEH
jgi:hypothetical protein